MAESVNTGAAAAPSSTATSAPAPPQLQQLPSLASPRAVSFSLDTGSSSSNRRPSRRRSAQERINDILEDARERADQLAQSSPSNPSPKLQPLLSGSPRVPNYLSGGSPRHGSPRLGPTTIPQETVGGGNDNGGVVTAQPEQQQHIHYSAGRHIDGVARRRSTRPSIRNLSRSSSHVDLADGAQEYEESRWKKSLKYFKSIELENKGSVARDHLALERTFLAWLRTSLAFASIGIAITQLFRLNTSLTDGNGQSSTLRHLGKPLGATFLGISILILFLGYNRYLESQYWVIKGKFPASRGTIILVSFIAFAVTSASLVVVVAVQRDS
ncbi:hypothetical protein QBC43DRAFT_259370 [Cladorrhinum sp. PSN259]|nr:hypothetical protein QBC43DRAFT_259370 [Cladorrhinum sp. PSN259]